MKYLIVAILLITGCSQQITIHTDFDPDYDLWKYKTFDWGQKVNIEESQNPLYYNELNDKRIKSKVKQQLTKRGYKFVSENPDLILHYHIIVKDQTVVITEPYGYTYGPYWERTKTNLYSYKEGTLILDLMDKKTSNLIWRGWAVTTINEVYSPEEIENLIDKVVGGIFKSFPKNKS